MQKQKTEQNPFNGEQVAVQEPAVAVNNSFAMDDNRNFIADLTSRTTSFCSLVATTPQDKAILFNIMNNPEKRLKDSVNMKINVKDIFAETVSCRNEQSGEMQVCPRIVLIDDKGVGYVCVSLGIFGAVKKLIQVYGTPTWDEPLPVMIKQKTKGVNTLLTLDVVF